MKKFIKTLFIISIVFILIGCKEFVYELNSDKTGYILKKYKGSSESVIIPELYKNLPVTEIGAYAFRANKIITGNFIIPKNVEIIDKWAFSECTSLTNITFHDNIKEIREGAFFSCSNLAGNLNIPKGLTKIDNSVFSGAGYTGLTIPDNIKIIETEAFSGSKLSGHIIIPDGVVEIGNGAFSFTYIKKITISKNVNNINDEMFRSCNELREFVIPEGVTDIGGWAFFECRELKSAVIPSTVTLIGPLSFGHCNNLVKITCNAIIPPAIADIAFENSPVKSIIVPEVSITAYQKADAWKSFANIITSQ